MIFLLDFGRRRLEKRGVMPTLRMDKLLLHGVGSFVPGASIGPAKWPHYDLIVVTDGSLDLSVQDTSVELKAGDAYLIPPRYVFCGVAGMHGAAIWVQHFQSARRKATKGNVLPRIPTRWPGVGQWEWPRTLMRRLSRLQKGSDQASDAAKSLLLALLLEEFQITRPMSKSEGQGAGAKVELVIDWIEHHALPLPPVEEIAVFAGWSVNYFRDQFRSVSGRTVGNFLTERRMMEAARLLIETGQPIKEIATLTGYGEVAAFHRAFQSRYNVTPGHYRKQRVPMV